mgnify:FL=1
MFTHIKHEIVRPFVKEEHTENGHYYRTDKGDLYPSITTLFKLLDPKDWYPHWVNSIAKKMNITEAEAEIECKRIGEASMKVGTALHLLAECHLKNLGDQCVNEVEKYDKDPNELFKPLKEHLDEHINNIHAIEAKLYHDEMRLAGTVDLIAEYDGVLSVIDFKNSRKPKMPSDIKKSHYNEQVTAYAQMWEFCTKQKIEQGVILVISWDGKVRPFKVNIQDYISSLWDTLINYQTTEALK